MFPAVIILFSLTLQVLSIGSPKQNPVFTLQDQGYASNDFKTIITSKKKMYIDKTLFIKEIMNSKDKSTLITRPPKFGKSLMLSTLDYFLSDQLEGSAELFSGLDIMKNRADLDRLRNEHMGKHPVIRVDLTNVKGSTFRESYRAFQESVSKEFLKHAYILNGRAFLTEHFESILHKNATKERTADAINWLCTWINAFHNGTKPCVVLLDGYDTPISTRFLEPVEEMEGLLKSFLLKTFKSNSNLKKAIITGVLTSDEFTEAFSEKKSIFREEYIQSFGFTEPEVRELVRRTQKGAEAEKKALDSVNVMFNGYSFFMNRTMFNPRAVTQYLFEGKTGGSTDPDSLKVLQTMLVKYGLCPVLTFQQLLSGMNVTKALADGNQEFAYWIYMLNFGYLTVVNLHESKSGSASVVLRIPNLEIRAVIATALDRGAEESWLKIPDYQGFLDNLARGNLTSAQKTLDVYLKKGGIFLKNSAQDYDADCIGRYVLQMLRGLEVRYDSKVDKRDYMRTEWETNDGRKIPMARVLNVYIRPNKKEGVPINVGIRKTRTTKVLWNSVNKMLCPTMKNLDPSKTEIVILYSEWFLSTCLVREGFMFSQLDSW